MMAINQTPGFNFDRKMVYGQMGLVGNREQAEMNVPHHRDKLLLIYHCALHISPVLPKLTNKRD